MRRERVDSSVVCAGFWRSGLALGLALGSAFAHAEEPQSSWRGGIQAGLAVPAGEDLRITTGPGLNSAFGLHATWDINEFNGLRPRLDVWTFSRGDQDVLIPQPQHLETWVQGTALGADYLYRHGGREGRWAAGAGLYLIRWSVKSTNRLSSPTADTALASGRSHWIREGLGFVVSYRVTPRLDAELHWISSHYGYENLPARMGTVGLLWHF